MGEVNKRYTRKSSGKVTVGSKGYKGSSLASKYKDIRAKELEKQRVLNEQLSNLETSELKDVKPGVYPKEAITYLKHRARIEDTLRKQNQLKYLKTYRKRQEMLFKHRDHLEKHGSLAPYRGNQNEAINIRSAILYSSPNTLSNARAYYLSSKYNNQRTNIPKAKSTPPEKPSSLTKWYDDSEQYLYDKYTSKIPSWVDMKKWAIVKRDEWKFNQFFKKKFPYLVDSRTDEDIISGKGNKMDKFVAGGWEGVRRKPLKVTAMFTLGAVAPAIGFGTKYVLVKTIPRAILHPKVLKYGGKALKWGIVGLYGGTKTVQLIQADAENRTQILGDAVTTELIPVMAGASMSSQSINFVQKNIGIKHHTKNGIKTTDVYIKTTKPPKKMTFMDHLGKTKVNVRFVPKTWVNPPEHQVFLYPKGRELVPFKHRPTGAFAPVLSPYSKHWKPHKDNLPSRSKQRKDKRKEILAKDSIKPLVIPKSAFDIDFQPSSKHWKPYNEITYGNKKYRKILRKKILARDSIKPLKIPKSAFDIEFHPYSRHWKPYKEPTVSRKQLRKEYLEQSISDDSIPKKDKATNLEELSYMKSLEEQKIMDAYINEFYKNKQISKQKVKEILTAIRLQRKRSPDTLIRTLRNIRNTINQNRKLQNIKSHRTLVDSLDNIKSRHKKVVKSRDSVTPFEKARKETLKRLNIEAKEDRSVSTSSNKQQLITLLKKPEVKSTLKTIQEAKTLNQLVGTRTRTKLNSLLGSKSKLDIRSKKLLKSSFKQKYLQKYRTLVASKSKLKSKSVLSSISKQHNNIKSIFAIVSKNKQGQHSLQKYKRSTKSKLRQRSKLITSISGTTSKTTKTPEDTTIVPPPLRAKGKTPYIPVVIPIKEPISFSKGYSVVVRDYDSKGTKKDKIVEIGSTLRDAIGHGMEYVDENPDTSFSLKPVNQRGKKYFGVDRAFKFSKKHGRWYEKNKYRMDRNAERSGFSMRRARQGSY